MRFAVDTPGMTLIEVLTAAVLPWATGIVWLVSRGGWDVLVPAPDEKLWTAGVWSSGRR